ncbi:hypothetical protein BV20DRAFT_334674 [Pilatotrama ljubarskyi]|nr:hypothetical protein BV20DRAFT_334674 [Pilatotrama ljubarskyi]
MGEYHAAHHPPPPPSSAARVHRRNHGDEAMRRVHTTQRSRRDASICVHGAVQRAGPYTCRSWQVPRGHAPCSTLGRTGGSISKPKLDSASRTAATGPATLEQRQRDWPWELGGVLDSICSPFQASGLSLGTSCVRPCGHGLRPASTSCAYLPTHSGATRRGTLLSLLFSPNSWFVLKSRPCQDRAQGPNRNLRAIPGPSVHHRAETRPFSQPRQRPRASCSSKMNGRERWFRRWIRTRFLIGLSSWGRAANPCETRMRAAIAVVP